jgi:hypothetical protein
MYRSVKPSFKSFLSTLPAIPVSKTPRRPRVCLSLLLVILTCGFLAFPVQAQECSQSIILADDFESDPSSRWTISRESTNPSTFVPRDWTWVHTLPDGRDGPAFFAPTLQLLSFAQPHCQDSAASCCWKVHQSPCQAIFREVAPLV